MMRDISLNSLHTSNRDVAIKKWGKDCGLLPKIIDIESEHQQHLKENKVYVLIGTLYKDMSLRGSVRLDIATALSLQMRQC